MLTFENQEYWNISSVGLEYYLDRVGVVGSNPSCSTKAILYGWLFL